MHYVSITTLEFSVPCPPIGTTTFTLQIPEVGAARRDIEAYGPDIAESLTRIYDRPITFVKVVR